MRRFFSDFWAETKSDPEDSGPTKAADLTRRMKHAAKPTVPFFIMLSLSAILATLGLISNSIATVIGAMIIAPLMSPIMSVAFGVADFDFRVILIASLTVAVGVLSVIGIGFLGTILIGAYVVGSEILSRTSPSLLDLVVALAAGCAGAYAQTRPKIADSIAGVAIAVALVPPLAVTGIGLALGADLGFDVGVGFDGFGLQNGGFDIAAGGFLLFLTNFVGIIFVSTIVFVVQGYGQWKKGLAVLSALVLGSYVLLPPLQDAFYKIYVKNRVIRLIDKNLDTDRFTAIKRKGLLIHTMGVDYREGTVFVALAITAGRDGLESAQEDLDQFASQIARDVKEPVRIKVDVGAVDILTFEAIDRPN
nr:DUF389 domain-containing protein [uncultured Roseibium sp.]